MRLVVISDIHGNITGMKAVLNEIQTIGGIETINDLPGGVICTVSFLGEK